MPAPARFVAVVDDEEPIRKALCRLLRACGIAVEAFASGQVFLDSLAARRADCLILDLRMPGFSGLQVLEQLQSFSRTLPTIVITGHDDPETRAHCVSAGAVAYLRKPFDEDSLMEAIEFALHGKSSQPSF
jgi:FixJ family two-component response regulator